MEFYAPYFKGSFRELSHHYDYKDDTHPSCIIVHDQSIPSRTKVVFFLTFEYRSTSVLLLALEKLFGEPLIEARFVSFLQFIALGPDALHDVLFLLRAILFFKF